MSSLAIGPETARNCQFSAESAPILGQSLLTRHELCRELRISYRAFSRLRANGGGPPGTWIGGKMMFAVSGVQRWMRDWTER